MKKGDMMERKLSLNRFQKEKIFVYLMLLYPLIHFAIFYIGVNFNSILLAFQGFDENTAQFKFLNFKESFANFIQFASDIVTYDLLRKGVKNSAILFLVGLLIQTPLNIFFAYFLYKKIPGNRFFRDILFLPAMVSTIVMVTIFKYFVEYGVPKIAEMMGSKDMPSLLIDPEYAFNMLIVYGLWAGFGGTLLLYANAMSKIPVQLVEYGKLEGMNAFQELIYLVFPFIYPTLTVFLVVSVAGFFSNAGPVFAFYAYDAPGYTYTIGYFMFTKVFRPDSSMVNFPYSAAGGILFTLIAAPLTLLVKWLLEKFGPDISI